VTVPPALDARPILEALNRHHVAYVLIGGYAALQHGATRPTQDIDVTPSTELENLGRLAAALKEMGAGIRVNDIPEGLPFGTSAEALRGTKMLNLRTPHGDVDLTFDPAGVDGYPDLARSATPRLVDGVTVQLAALADIIRSKTAAARNKDLEALPELEALAASRKSDDPPPTSTPAPARDSHSPSQDGRWAHGPR